MKALLVIFCLTVGTQAAFANVDTATEVAKQELKTSDVVLTKEYATVYLFSRSVNSTKNPEFFADLDLQGENYNCDLQVAVKKQSSEAVSPMLVEELASELDKASNYYALDEIEENLLRVCDFN